MIYLLQPEADGLPITHLSPITTTDDKEYYPNFSPDGRYLVFNRYVSLCDSHRWAKDLVDNHEFQLTKTAARYGSAAWSPDGQQLAFSYAPKCITPQSDECLSIHTLSFPLAKTDSQLSRSVLNCKKQDHVGINWLSNTQMTLITRNGNKVFLKKTTVQSLSVPDGAITVLYTNESLSVIALSYSNKQTLLAITAQDKAKNTHLILLDTKTNITEQITLKVPAKLAGYFRWDLNWHPNGQSLITAVNNSIFTISLEGEFTEYPITTTVDINHPTYHPDGDQIAATMGVVDFDIGQYEWQQQNVSSEILYRSNVEDYGGQLHLLSPSQKGKISNFLYQNGQLIVFDATHSIFSYQPLDNTFLKLLSVDEKSTFLE